jgi:hypothetical protein
MAPVRVMRPGRGAPSGRFGTRTQRGRGLRTGPLRAEAGKPGEPGDARTDPS